MKDILRNGVNEIPLPPVGSPSDAVRKKYGVDAPIQLCFNENPFGSSPKAMAALRRETESMARYPEAGSGVLRAAIADRFGVSAECVAAANGMDGILVNIAQAFLNGGDEVISCGTTFYAYGFGAARMQAKYTELPLIDYKFDLSGILDAINERTKLIFICNPNNPTGTIVRKSETDEFMRRVPEDVIVVFDEAYAEYVTDAEYAHGMDYVREGGNVIVGRTFSKIYGLAGCRVGYCIGKTELITPIRRICEVFNVNRAGQAAALAALDDTEFVEDIRKRTSEGRDYLTGEFTKLSMRSTESAGNFIFVDIHRNAADAVEALKARGIIVSAGYKGCPECLRITIGTMEQNRLIVSAIAGLKS